MSSRLDKILVISGLLSFLVILSIDVFLAPFYPGYDYYSDVISMLGAVDSPVAFFTNILFFLFGFFMLLYGFGLYRNYAEDNWAKLGSIIFIAIGAGLSLIGVFQCDPGCVDVTLTAEVHQFFSEVPMMIAPVGVIFFVFHEFGGKGFRGKGDKFFLYILLAIIILGTLFTAIHVEFNMDRNLNGFYERLAIYVPVSLMALTSLYLYKEKFIKN